MKKIHRRHFLRLTALYAACHHLFWRLLAKNASAQTREDRGMNSFVKEATDGIYIHVGKQEAPSPQNGGDMSVMGFIVGEESVAVLDTGHSVALGAQLLDAIRATTDKPIKYVVLTHVHPDHIFGAAPFAKLDPKPEFWAHEKYLSRLENVGPYYLEGLKDEIGDAAAGAELIKPDFSVSPAQDTILDLGNRAVHLKAWRTSHTDGDVTLWDEKTDTLLASDLLFDERIPILAGSLLGWRKTLEDIKNKNHAMIIPGHGEPATGQNAIAMIERLDGYFAVLEKDVRAILAKGEDIKEASETAALSERDKWLLFDLYNGRNAINATKELEWE